MIGFAILAGALLGSLVLIALVLVDRLPSFNRVASVEPGITPSVDDQVVFLFSERTLIQMTDTGAAFLDKYDNSDRVADSEQDDWARILHIFGPRFAKLLDHTMRMRQKGQTILTALSPEDTGQLIIDWWDGHTRITLIEPVKRDRAHAIGLQDEADWLRQAVTGAPYPIWQSDPQGRVVWANTAYLDLVKRFKTDDQVTSKISSLFNIPLQSPDGLASFRVSVTPKGAMNPYWFDIRSLKLETGWMNYATDVNAVVNAEIAQRNFVQTLTKTFAQLSIGLAIFDRKRQLALFNPALIDLTTLPAEFLSARPNLLSFFDRLRDRNMMPEPKNYRSWRDQITDLVAAADSGQYRETWTLPSGLTYRISGRPHPDGAVAFLFEDISAEISSTRRFRSQLELGQSVLNTLDQSIAVFSASGLLAFSNTAYRQMWNIDPDSSFADISVNDASRHWQAGSQPTPVWGDLRDFVVQFGERSEWSADIMLKDGRPVNCQVVPMPGGTTLVTFQIDSIGQIAAIDSDLRSTA
jgi:PAS domain-containing protein